MSIRGEMGILEIQEAMRSGETTAQSLVEYYLERIDAFDRQGPQLNSVLETNPDAMESAERLDKERSESGPRSALHGIPVVLKGNIGTADRMTTTAGSLVLAGSIPARDAFIVEQLRGAGAVILGKANLSEWANFRGKNSLSGWSSQGGQTRNPYDANRSPCGSSVCPAQTCGIVGIKPTLGW